MPIVVQPPVVTLLVVLSAWLLHSLLGPWPTIVRVPVLGGALVALGFSLMMWARILFTSRNTTLFVGRPSSQLVCDGPFRFSRNPMYVGVVVFLVGLALWVGTWPFYMAVPVAFLLGSVCCTSRSASGTMPNPRRFAVGSEHRDGVVIDRRLYRPVARACLLALGRSGRATCGDSRIDGKLVFQPSALATLMVAIGLALCAVLVAGTTGMLTLPLSQTMLTWMTRELAMLVLLRAIGDFRLVRFSKRIRHTRFARLDTVLYSPLCLAMAVGSAIVGVSG